MKPCVLALGFFDGVHIGHGRLLRRVRQIADARNITAAAITFDRHPASFLSGVHTPLINTVSERVLLMEQQYGIDEVYVLTFDDAFCSIPWQDFAQMIRAQYGAEHIVCGFDYRFGAKGEGTPRYMAQFCEENGIGFDAIGAVELEGTVVSSTYIRAALQDGRMQEACRFLGHPHLLSGTVVGGCRIGRTLGIPTANMQIAESILLPKCGVYAARANVEGECYPAVVNIGMRPTFDGKTLTVEPWLLDFDRDIYGKEITLELFSYLREERRFETKEALQTEIYRNEKTVRELWKGL